MAMVNQMLNLTGQVKDSRWLTLEVCREFQRSKCSRTENECKFAHPPAHVEVQNGRVTACFDSIKGKCQRKDPPCKYLHPPQHLKEQLLQNGRNNLILKNLQMQAVQQASIQPIVPGMVPTVYPTVMPQKYDRPKEIPERGPKLFQAPGSKALAYPTVLPGQFPLVIEDGYSSDHYSTAARHSHYQQASSALSQLYINGPPTMMPTHPYIGTVPTSAVGFNPYSCMTGVPAMNLPSAATDSAQVSQPVHGVVPASQQKVVRPDRLEVCREFQRGTCTRQPSECRFAHPPENVTVDSTDNNVTVCMDYIKGKCTRDSCRYFHPPHHLQVQIKAAQQRANVATVQAQAMPQVVEVLTGKKRPRDPQDDLVLNSIPGMVPYAKRMAVTDSKSGVPMYQPAAGLASYQQALAAMQLQQQPYIPVTLASLMPAPPSTAVSPVSLSSINSLPSNTTSVNYFDENDKLQATLQVCRDFRSGLCQRPQCKYVHLTDDQVDVSDGMVTVCRDAAKGRCQRQPCRYYHIPLVSLAL